VFGLLYFTVITILFLLLTNTEGGGSSQKFVLLVVDIRCLLFSSSAKTWYWTSKNRKTECCAPGSGTTVHWSTDHWFISKPRKRPSCLLNSFLGPTRQIPRDYMLGTQHPTLGRYTTRHDTTQHNTTQHNTTQHNTTQHNTTQHNTTQHTVPSFCGCVWTVSERKTKNHPNTQLK
jgi:hypothetical protein